MRDFRFLRTTWKSLLKVPPQNHKCQPPRKQNGKVLFYHSKCKTKPVLLSMVPPFADHYVLPSRKIPIRILSTLWGQTTPSVLRYKRRCFFFKMAPKKSGKASGFHLIGIQSQSSWLSVDMVGNYNEPYKSGRHSKKVENISFLLIYNKGYCSLHSWKKMAW